MVEICNVAVQIGASNSLIIYCRAGLQHNGLAVRCETADETNSTASVYKTAAINDMCLELELKNLCEYLLCTNPKRKQYGESEGAGA